ncbi:TIGR02647 family protein [Zobellella endophytica]|uniref:TIGR02647 family protein n=1 Tax=Zobellella endophytica TaxID=2116700 RepID=A0A2P7RCV2_9GAMM|nr:TIGR02647 family protein [Zobellella endophytica]PSJ48068.1 TIGR02647 family protein [Zobellella endophytica]
MRYNQALLDELNLLLHFDLDTTQQGIKVHHDADPALIGAAQRLYDKGLITLHDGGYLTDLGREAAEHAQGMLGLLKETTAA